MPGHLRRDWTAPGALAGYLLVSFAFWGVRLLPHPGRFYVGTGADPQIFVWALGWWPHALAHGLNPVLTTAIWAPQGENLAWVTSVPSLSLAAAPIDWLWGPVVAYDAVALAMPALAAWTAFLLCRHLTRSTWASLAGGYVFGFSSYLLGQLEGHLHMTSVFLLPLVALAVLRYLEHELGGIGLALRLGPLVALQLGLSTENAFTLTLALAATLVLAFALVPAARHRVAGMLPALAAAYALGCALAAPLLYYAVKGFQSGSINEPSLYPTDLLNLVVPTRLTLAGGDAARTISAHFPASDSERGGYLGIPALAILALYLARRWRTVAGRMVLACFATALVCSFGIWLVADGHRVMTMPWEHVGYLPLFDNVLPARLMVFASLVLAVAVALWTCAARGALRIVLPALAIVSLLPDPTSPAWKTPAHVPAFFRGDAVRRCLAPGETVLTFPQAKDGSAMTWQAVSGYRFRLADGYVTPDPPSSFLTSTAAARIAYHDVTRRDLAAFVREKHVAAVLVDASHPDPWRRLLAPLATPHEVAGVLLYRLGGGGRRC